MERKTQKVEFGSFLFYLTPTEADEWQYHACHDMHYCEEDNMIYVYRLDDFSTSWANYYIPVHMQQINTDMP